MMLRRIRLGCSLSLIVSAVLGVSASESALACACCTNPGQRYVEKLPFDSSKRAVFRSVEFAHRANLYVGEGGAESINGIDEPSERYAMSVSWSKSSFIFSFRNHRGAWGKLVLGLPQTVSVFEVDPRESEGRGNGPTLYKEWKITGKVGGDGVFSPATGPNQLLTLILQGRGNSCTSASDFDHWTLVMQGPKGHYIMFGELVQER
jgi:hypothetical protein